MYAISSSNRDRSPSESRQRNRSRGVILSKQGWQKLTQAGVLHDQWGNRHTYEKLSERSLLNDRTISRILSCEVRVDKRSLKTFFAALGLQLHGDDYLAAVGAPADQTIDSLSHYLNSTIHSAETTLSHQELMRLYQRLKQDLSHLSHLLRLHEMNESISLQ
ncbi:MAG: hypothetical protein KME45_09010 [Stenomitos rutilans HA7619-LM2]|jgi:hypothetical protein|nr:hypothetical protein [Stenomitos rutilans HA7619-LM2]